MRRKEQHFASSSCCMFSSIPWNMSWNPIWEFRLSAKFWCKFSPCCALLGPSPTISRQESKSCRTEDRVSGSSPQPSTFQEKYIHTFRQCITELDLISDQLHFKILLFGIAHWCREIDHVFIHPYHSGQYLSVTTNSNADFCLNCKKVRTTKLKIATIFYTIKSDDKIEPGESANACWGRCDSVHQHKHQLQHPGDFANDGTEWKCATGVEEKRREREEGKAEKVVNDTNTNINISTNISINAH